MTAKRTENLGLHLPSKAEDAAIRAGIDQDADTQELGPADLARMRPLGRPGRPALATPKVPMTMRVDADVLSALKASGSGWQTRVNQLLREAVRQGKLGV